MALSKLPLDLQSKFSASAQIRCFKSAVEELVYNAFDAKSSSIAVRVDVKDNYIQVVDNGYGVTKKDFKLLGERYATSKFEKDVNEPVSIYGRCGQSLANIIEVSQSVKITSKCMNNAETWMKCFINGKEEACSVVTERPSVGTTVEIRGFLYNHCIQRKALKELEELQNVKTFLEKMALLHCNTSISLRDNSRNEIIFKVHKNRDIIQTIASTLNICTSSLQELQVQKNNYKVTGYIQNNNKEARGYQWIYVNGRYIDKSNLHQMINKNLVKGAPANKNMKAKGYKNEEEKSVPNNNRLPDYFLFIKCPAFDYAVICHYNKLILDFKNEVHVHKLLDKLVKFYTGDINPVKMSTISKELTSIHENNNVHGKDTKNKVKEIIGRILGSQKKKMNGSNLHNGVKGKIMRRKLRKKDKSSLKVQIDDQHHHQCIKGIREEGYQIYNSQTTNNNCNYNTPMTPVPLPPSKSMTKKKRKNEKILKVTNQAPKKNCNKQRDLSFLKPMNDLSKKEKMDKTDQKQLNKEKNLHIPKNLDKVDNHNKKEPVLSKFEKETDEVQNRCNILTEKVDHLLGVKKRRRCKVFTNEISIYSNIVKNNKSISVRKKINEIIVHEYVPLAKKDKNKCKENKILKDIKTSDDLLCPIVNVIDDKIDKNLEGNAKHAKMVQPQEGLNFFYSTNTYESKVPGPTFDSHTHLKNIQIPFLQKDIIEKTKINHLSKTTQDNSILPITNKEMIKIQEACNETRNDKTNYLQDSDVVKCPAFDYAVICHYNKLILDFKNEVHVHKLLDKLVKFYTGDINPVKMSTISKELTSIHENNNVHGKDTKNKVKEIIGRILGSQKKKMNGSNLHNGVKGKIMRRKLRKKDKSSLKVQIDDQHHHQCIKGIREEGYQIYNSQTTNNNCNYNTPMTPVPLPPSKSMTKKKRKNEKILKVTNQAPKKNCNKQRDLSFLKPMNDLSKKEKMDKTDQKQLNKEKNLHIPKNLDKVDNHNKKEPVLSKFEKETDEVQNRCNILTEKVDHLLGVKKRRRCKVFTNEISIYSNIVKNNKSISVRKKINEIIVHEYVPLAKKDKNKCKENKILKDIKTSDDLLCPIVNVIDDKIDKNLEGNAKHAKMVQPQEGLNFFYSTNTYESKVPGPTFDSHTHLKNIQIPFLQKDIIEKTKINHLSKTTQDNSILPITNKEMIKIQEACNETRNDKTNYLQDSDVVKCSIICTTHSKIQTEEAAVNTSTGKKDNYEMSIGNTYTLANFDKSGSADSNKKIKSQTYIIDTASNYEADECSHNFQDTQKNTAVVSEQCNNNNDVVFISNSELAKTERNSIEPIQLCQAVIGSHNEQNREEIIEDTFFFDSINNVIEGNTNIQSADLFEYETNSKRFCSIQDETPMDDFLNINLNKITSCKLNNINLGPDNFNLKNRRRYIPKGMSPMFENCNFNIDLIHNNEVDEDYFESPVYNNFAQNVQLNSEIFEPMIQNVKEATTTEILRVDIKLKKDEAGLTFNAGSLQNAKVLGQVDSKFIATILNVDSNGEHSCLVLFDQHAVHERIRLEQNMSDYIFQDQWKSISVDGFSLKLDRDEILYLHNYRDKFEKLGLQWTIAGDTEVLVHAIPKAILGKHLRQTDVVLKAVNNLIWEEINIIKEQSGCVSLYPKSIMELVFSEACRYAIMFGTTLTLSECSSLIEGLSTCRTPFQCAHGRPALAVLVDVVRESYPYKISFKNVEKFRLKQKKLQKK